MDSHRNDPAKRTGSLSPSDFPPQSESERADERSGRQSVRMMFLAAAVLLAVSIGVMYWVGRMAVESQRERVQERTVIGELSEFLSVLKDAETGQRGYLMTGQEQYLEPYDDAVRHLKVSLNGLRRLAEGGEIPEEAARKVLGLADTKVAELKQTIKLRREVGLEASLEVVGSGKGKQLMDQIRSEIAGMQAGEEAKYGEATRAAAWATRASMGVFIALSLGNLIFLGWTYRRIGRETAEREQAEEALQKSHDELEQRVRERTEALRLAGVHNRSLLEASLDPLVTIDPEGRISDVNAATELATGYAREELIGTDFSDYFTEPENARSGYRQVFSKGFVRNYELYIRHRNGQITPVRYNASVYRDEAEKVIGVFAAARDITERKRAEEEARRYAAQLESSNRELQDFAFVSSHDLQEPLRKIQAFGDQLKSGHAGSLDAEGLDYLDRMQNAAARMQALIEALLNYSRVTTKAQPFFPTDLATVAREVVGDLETRIHEVGGQVEIGDLPVIEADPIQLRQLFQNLIGNALKFHTEEKPLVRIYGQPVSHGQPISRSADGNCRIFIEDNGIGFDEKYLDRIFTPFQRLHGRAAYEGTGIGLAICRKIVDRHGGTITAKSTPGKGSTFIVTLPVKQPKGGTA